MASDLSRKLGLKPGQTVYLLDAPADTGKTILEAAPDGVNFVRGLDEARCDLVLFWPGVSSTLTRIEATGSSGPGS